MTRLILVSLGVMALAGCSQEPAAVTPTAPVSLVGQAMPAAGFVITNARIIDGTGQVIDNGSVVVQEGRIVSVSAGPATVADALVIDAGGKTVMPGFIDAHRHIIQGDPVAWLAERAQPKMQEFLDAGFTTVLSAGDSPEHIVELRRRINDNEIPGPRLITSGFVMLAAPEPPPPGPRVDPARTDVSRPPDRPTRPARGIPEATTREAVQRLKALGIDNVKSVITVTPRGPEVGTLKVIVDEAQKNGLKSIVHAVHVDDMLAAVSTRPAMLVHTPHIGQITPEQAKIVADAGIPMTSTLGVFVPGFAESNELMHDRSGDDNLPRFRDLDPFPMHTLSSAGQGPVNARILFDAGVVYGYGTDVQFLPQDALRHELVALRLVFSAKDIVKIMTQNAATVVGMPGDIGTLEAGKLADIVLIDGNPLENVEDLLKVELVVKGGQVVADKRT